MAVKFSSVFLSFALKIRLKKNQVWVLPDYEWVELQIDLRVVAGGSVG